VAGQDAKILSNNTTSDIQLIKTISRKLSQLYMSSERSPTRTGVVQIVAHPKWNLLFFNIEHGPEITPRILACTHND
jgi:hypothetical protein